MKYENITLGSNVEIDPSSTFNNVIFKDRVKIANGCNIYGGPDNQLELGTNSYVGMKTIINGFAAKIIIGDNVSISQYVNIMVDSGPNASPGMQKIFPIEKGPINIGNDCWIGASAIIMPNVTLGEYCIVAANSYVNKSFPAFSIIGGTPAKLIRSFTDGERKKIMSKSYVFKQSELSHYELNYINLPFEDILRKYRKKNIFQALKKYSYRRFLEIGCGPDPLFPEIKDFEKMVIVEPERKFAEMAKSMSTIDSNIEVINDLIENVTDNLKREAFNFVVIGGFLHEIQNPDIVLQAVREICIENTIVYSFAPNARSFHRLLADKMGAIENIYERSEHDELFERQSVYEINTFNELFTRNKFKVVESGTYFVKPFTHSQMNELLNHKIISKNCLEGLDKMIDYMPDMGAELWNICKIDG